MIVKMKEVGKYHLILSTLMMMGLLVFPSTVGFAQEKIKLLEGADYLKLGKNEQGESYQIVYYDVIFSHKNTLIYGDSAHFTKSTNILEMFGDIKIEDGDSITVTADKLIYDGNTRTAKLRDNVVFEKLGKVTLYTDFLDYDRNEQLAYYYDSGKLVDSVNTLTSDKGYYQINTGIASFRKDVVAKDPNHTLESDTLQYNTRTNVVYFRSPTTVTDADGSVFNYGEGEYDTNQKRSNFEEGTMESPSYNLTAKRLFADDVNRYYRATKDVEIISKSNNIIINSDISETWENQGLTKVYDNAVMKQVTDGDTLYITADTLISIDSEIEAEKKLLAYNNVKIYKSDLQGKADSMAYIMSDSIIYFYTDPVLWNDGNQLSADSINIFIANNTIDRLNMSVNSFVISEDTVKNFNQVKGREMVARFVEGKIDKVDVTGNGESIYYVLDDETNQLMGINKSICSNITINFEDNLVDNIMLYVNPEAVFVPPHEIEDSHRKLKGFSWQIDKKPTKAEVVLGHTVKKVSQPPEIADLLSNEEASPKARTVSTPLEGQIEEKDGKKL